MDYPISAFMFTQWSPFVNVYTQTSLFNKGTSHIGLGFTQHHHLNWLHCQGPISKCNLPRYRTLEPRHINLGVGMQLNSRSRPQCKPAPLSINYKLFEDTLSSALDHYHQTGVAGNTLLHNLLGINASGHARPYWQQSQMQSTTN